MNFAESRWGHKPPFYEVSIKVFFMHQRLALLVLTTFKERKTMAQTLTQVLNTPITLAKKVVKKRRLSGQPDQKHVSGVQDDRTLQ